MGNIAKEITDSFIRAIEFDSQRAADKQKYSNWILGLATAGFALALTQTDKLVAMSCAPPSVGNAILKTVVAVFIASAVVGAVVVRSVDRQIHFNRHR